MVLTDRANFDDVMLRLWLGRASQGFSVLFWLCFIVLAVLLTAKQYKINMWHINLKHHHPDRQIKHRSNN